MEITLPFVSRKAAQAEADKRVTRAYAASREQFEKEKQEWERVALPVLRRMVEMTAERRYDDRSFVLHFNLDRRMVEQAATYNDSAIWRYIAELVGRHVERELSTMNFAGLHRMADDFERKHRRTSVSSFSSLI